MAVTGLFKDGLESMCDHRRFSDERAQNPMLATGPAASGSLDPGVLRSEQFLHDPYPFYRELRQSSKPSWFPHDQGTASGGLLLISRHADAAALFRRSEGVSKDVRAVRTSDQWSAFDLNVLHRDAPAHLRLRRVAQRCLAPQNIPAWQARADRIASELLSRVRADGGGDLQRDFALPLPMRMLSEVSGLPVEELQQVREWTLAIIDGMDSMVSSPQARQRQAHAMQEFLKFAKERLAEATRRGGAGMLGQLADALKEDLLSFEEAQAMLCFLLLAGHETTISLIASAAWLLLSHPSQWQRLREDPGLLDGAVDETLRYESPEQRSTFRIVTESFCVGDVQLEPGQQLAILIGSANRDEAVFARADEFLIDRAHNPHLAFGIGPHHCLGKALARLQCRAALAALREQLRVELLEAQPRWRKNSFFRSLEELPVRVA